MNKGRVGAITKRLTKAWWRRTSSTLPQERHMKRWMEYVQRQLSTQAPIRKPPPRQISLPSHLIDDYIDLLNQVHPHPHTPHNLFTYPFCRKSVCALAKRAIQRQDKAVFIRLMQWTLEPNDRSAIKMLGIELLERERSWLNDFLNLIEPYVSTSPQNHQHEQLCLSTPLISSIEHTPDRFFDLTGIGYSNISHFGWMLHHSKDLTLETKNMFIQNPNILNLLEHKENHENLLVDLVRHIEFYTTLYDRAVMFPQEGKDLTPVNEIVSLLTSVAQAWDRWIWKDMMRLEITSHTSPFSKKALDFAFQIQPHVAFFKQHEHAMADLFVTRPAQSKFLIALLHRRLPCDFYFERALLGGRWFEASLFADYASEKVYQKTATRMSEKAMGLISPYQMMYASLFRAQLQAQFTGNRTHFQEKRRRKL